MTHADDDGLVLPPRLAPQHVVILPIFRSRRREGARARVLPQGRSRAARRSATPTRRCACIVDDRDMRGGEKIWQWIKKGVPLRARDRPARHREGRRVRGAPRPRAEGQAERRARRVRRARSQRRCRRSRTACSRARRRSATSTRARSTTRRVLRVLHEPSATSEDTPTPIHGGLRADALQRRPRARAEDQGRSRSPCAASRSRRASPARARSRASRARSAWSGPRRTDREAAARWRSGREARARRRFSRPRASGAPPTLPRWRASVPKLVATRDNSGRTALHVCSRRQPKDAAERKRALATARALVAAGADVNAIHEIPDDGEIFPATALWHALVWGRNRPLGAYLLARGSDPNHCLFGLVWNDDLVSAKLVRRYGAELDEFGHGETPLIYAARHQRVRFAEWLLAPGRRRDAARPARVHGAASRGAAAPTELDAAASRAQRRRRSRRRRQWRDGRQPCDARAAAAARHRLTDDAMGQFSLAGLPSALAEHVPA